MSTAKQSRDGLTTEHKEEPVAKKDRSKPKRQKTTLDEAHGQGPAKKTDPRALEREHDEHQPGWTHQHKHQPQHRRNDKGAPFAALRGWAA